MLSILIGLIKRVEVIPMVRGFSLLPFINFDNLGSVLWYSDKNRDGFFGLGGRGGALLANDQPSG